jgi:hypothetical protein
VIEWTKSESIARQANKEDGCTGRYWEGRYKSQALLDEKSLAICMSYIDLNPIRAGMAVTPEQSAYTSIAERIKPLTMKQDCSGDHDTPKELLPFAGNPREDMPKGLPFRPNDYIELVDWTGRVILNNKRGHIFSSQPPVLERLQIDTKHWLSMTQDFESRFKGLLGSCFELNAAYRKLVNSERQIWVRYANYLPRNTPRIFADYEVFDSLNVWRNRQHKVVRRRSAALWGPS